MTETPHTRVGGCLCGKVRFTANVVPEVQACHCVQCQRWTGGGPLLTVRVHELELSGAQEIHAYHHSTWGERSVCRTCGTSIYWKMQGRPISSVAVGLLDEQTGLTVTEEIFVDYRPAWLKPWPGATQSTEAEQLAQLSAFFEGDGA
ncbi:MAG: GFA family protein [Pseudomonadota bacterium]